jgi:hypothetical protein
MTALRFGKHPPVVDYRTLSLKTYLAADIAPAPATYDVLATVYKNLGTNSTSTLFPMDGNDSLGNCTIAGLAHSITVFNGLIGKKKIMPQPAVIKLYNKLTGGIDSGLNELKVLNYWQSNVVDGEKIFAFTTINVKNHDHIKQAIEIFGGVYLGFRVQQNCLSDFKSQIDWTPGTLTNEGHAVFAVGYDETGVTVLTWGSTQKGTWAWWDECVDEAYAILPPEAEKATFKPGFNFAQLKVDLGLVAS